MTAYYATKLSAAAYIWHGLAQLNDSALLSVLLNVYN